jgi:hypothetical protein
LVLRRLAASMSDLAFIVLGNGPRGSIDTRNGLWQDISSSDDMSLRIKASKC